MSTSLGRRAVHARRPLLSAVGNGPRPSYVTTSFLVLGHPKYLVRQTKGVAGNRKTDASGL